MASLLVLKTLCLGLATMSVIHFAFSPRLLTVPSLSWDGLTRNRMHLIISVKAVFILIWCLSMPSILPFLCRACRHSNYLIAQALVCHRHGLSSTEARDEPTERKGRGSLCLSASLWRCAQSALSLTKWGWSKIA